MIKYNTPLIHIIDTPLVAAVSVAIAAGSEADSVTCTVDVGSQDNYEVYFSRSKLVSNDIQLLSLIYLYTMFNIIYWIYR